MRKEFRVRGNPPCSSLGLVLTMTKSSSTRHRDQPCYIIDADESLRCGCCLGVDTGAVCRLDCPFFALLVHSELSVNSVSFYRL